MNLIPHLRWLLLPAILLPMLVAVLFGLMGLLSAIHDSTGAYVVQAVGWTCLVLWMVNIAALAIGAALELVTRGDDKGNEL